MAIRTLGVVAALLPLAAAATNAELGLAAGISLGFGFILILTFIFFCCLVPEAHIANSRIMQLSTGKKDDTPNEQTVVVIDGGDRQKTTKRFVSSAPVVFSPDLTYSAKINQTTPIPPNYKHDDSMVISSVELDGPKAERHVRASTAGFASPTPRSTTFKSSFPSRNTRVEAADTSNSDDTTLTGALGIAIAKTVQMMPAVAETAEPTLVTPIAVRPERPAAGAGRPCDDQVEQYLQSFGQERSLGTPTSPLSTAGRKSFCELDIAPPTAVIDDTPVLTEQSVKHGIVQLVEESALPAETETVIMFEKPPGLASPAAVKAPAESAAPREPTPPLVAAAAVARKSITAGTAAGGGKKKKGGKR